MEKLVGDKREDGGAAGRDAALGHEDEEAREEEANVRGGSEFGKFREKIGGEVGGVTGSLGKRDVQPEMAETETCPRRRARIAAAFAILIAKLAAGVVLRWDSGYFNGGAGVSGGGVHDFPR